MESRKGVKINKKKTEVNGLKNIIVTGDVSIDFLEVSTPPVISNGTGNNYNWNTYTRTKHLKKLGGAMLLAEFLRSATKGLPINVIAPNILNAEEIPPDRGIHSFISLKEYPYSFKSKEKMVYRVDGYKGFDGPDDNSLPYCPVLKDDNTQADIVVLNDAGNGFNSNEEVWPKALQGGNKPLVLLKTNNFTEKNLLWEELVKNHADNLIVVIDANHLRKEGVKISRCLSWERTARDFVWQIAFNIKLVNLSKCNYLIVRFGVEGAILYVNHCGAVNSWLFFDPKLREDAFSDECPGKMLGIGSAFVAALTAEIALNGLENEVLIKGIRQALLSARLLWRFGFGKKDAEIGYPDAKIFNIFENESIIADTPITCTPIPESADLDFWCIINDLKQTSLKEIAYELVKKGAEQTLSSVPMGMFSKLVTFDRTEIEGFQSIRNLIKEYLDSPNINHPLSIAAFGSPGSGKSFSIMQVAESAAPGKLNRMEFNLSQFESTKDLVRAFHRVRDVILMGKTPIVFFDEFDSNFNGELGWLKYFLVPMQEGKFKDGDTIHPIGKAVFVFAGGTCSTFSAFSRDGDLTRMGLENNEGNENSFQSKRETKDKEYFKMAKGPDFVSRLRGYVNIKGPNQLNEEDKLYIIRRASTLRVLLEENAENIKDSKGELQIDPGVLRAMINISEYKHGLRSMSAIIEMSVLAGRKSFEQAALPSPEQLELHVNADDFMRLVMGEVLFRGIREALAIATHEKYRQEQEGEKPFNHPSMAPWQELNEEIKESYLQQVDRIPVELAAIDCEIVPLVNRRPNSITFGPDEIEVMAQIEHEYWVKGKGKDGCRFGAPGNDNKKTHPDMVEWNELSPGSQDINRNIVKNIPEYLSSLRFEVRRIK